MSYGYAGHILRVDLTNQAITVEQTRDYARDYLGGRGINHRILVAEVGPEVPAFDPRNRLVIGVGPLVGTLIPSSSRTQVTFRSPYPSGWGDSNVGGHWGPELKYAGFDHIVIQGRSPKPVYLWISDGRAELRDAAHLWGMFTDHTQQTIQEELGDPDVKVLSIGPAGERMVRMACLMTENTDAAGRSGAGAVMGSKNLKAIAVRGTLGVRVADPEAALQLSMKALARFSKEESLIELSIQGTPASFPGIGSTGMVPIKNHHLCGIWKEGEEKIGGEALVRGYEVRRDSCFGCPVGCKCYYRVEEGEYKGVTGTGPTYETIGSIGYKTLCDDMPAVLYGNTLLNQYGLDSVSTGNVIAVVMDLYDQGMVKSSDIDGIEAVWGNADAVIALIRKIGEREGIGEALANDVVEWSASIGNDAEYYVMHNKGLTGTCVELRSSTGAALSFGVSPRGAHHLSGIPTCEWVPDPVIAEFVSGYREGADTMSYHPLAKANQVVFYEHLLMLHDCLGICHFPYGHEPTWHENPEGLQQLRAFLVDALASVTGDAWTDSELFEVAERAFNLERAFIARNGMRRKDDRLSERVYTESCPGEHSIGPTPLPPIDRDKYETMLDAYYEKRGWDSEGIPTKRKLAALGLAWLDPELDALRSSAL